MRPCALLVDRPRQDRTFLDEIDQLQPSLRTLQLRTQSDLDGVQTADEQISWLSPIRSHPSGFL